MKTSTKPVRIKRVCAQTKSKAIIDVYWSHLSGNKEPYLSVSVIQLKKNGVRLENYGEESAEFLREFAPELYQVKSMHLTEKSGAGMHQHANFNYHFGLLKRHVAKTPLTIEKISQQLKGIKEGLEKFEYRGKTSYILELVKKRVGLAIVEDHYDELFNLNFYTETSINRHLNYLGKCYKTGAGFTSAAMFDKWLDHVKSELKRYHTLKEKITRYQTPENAPISSRDVWTLERFCNTYTMDQECVKNLFFLDEEQQKTEIDKIINEKVLTDKAFLDSITEKYNIPVIKG